MTKIHTQVHLFINFELITKSFGEVFNDTTFFTILIELLGFIRAASAGGARKFVLHSRKCLLQGLTTKQNRDIPPLKYEVVHSLVKDFPVCIFQSTFIILLSWYLLCVKLQCLSCLHKYHYSYVF